MRPLRVAQLWFGGEPSSVYGIGCIPSLLSHHLYKPSHGKPCSRRLYPVLDMLLGIDPRTSRSKVLQRKQQHLQLSERIFLFFQLSLSYNPRRRTIWSLKYGRAQNRNLIEVVDYHIYERKIVHFGHIGCLCPTGRAFGYTNLEAHGLVYQRLFCHKQAELQQQLLSTLRKFRPIPQLHHAQRLAYRLERMKMVRQFFQPMLSQSREMPRRNNPFLSNRIDVQVFLHTLGFVTRYLGMLQ